MTLDPVAIIYLEFVASLWLGSVLIVSLYLSVFGWKTDKAELAFLQNKNFFRRFLSAAGVIALMFFLPFLLTFLLMYADKAK